MMSKIKRYGREGMAVATTGIGLATMASVDSTGAAGKMAKAMPMIGSLVATKMVVESSKELLPKKKF